MKRYGLVVLCAALLVLACSGCAKQNGDAGDTSGMEFGFEEEDIRTDITPQDGRAIDLSDTDLTGGDKNMRITSGGAYTLTGTKTDCMLIVDAPDENVQLILNGITIDNANGPAVYIKEAGHVTITLADGTANTLRDGASYTVTDEDSTLDAAIFSRADLTINGTGTLNVTGRYKHGVVSKDDLIISSGTLDITANNVGLDGKDCVKINAGNITIDAGSDGIRASNEEDTTRGYVYLNGGAFTVRAGNDGIQAATVVKIDNATLDITAGGGGETSSMIDTTESYKGIKAGSDIAVSGGCFTISSQDDSLHSNGTITMEGGAYTLTSGDDGVHADTDLAISGDDTKLTVTRSYEGLEASSVVIAGGTVSLTASDDGINAAGGNDSSAIGGRPGQGQFTASTGKVVIAGGTIYINASGDAIDSNGTLQITGGDITVSGANQGDTAILDFDTTGEISGGTFVGTGAAGMVQNFSSSSTQGVIMVQAGGQAGTQIILTDESGKTILTHTADQAFSCVILSHADIQQGETYTFSVGSSETSITMTGTVYGGSGGMGGMGGFGGGMGGSFGGGNRPGDRR